ncbi:hypothetical protein EV121DRAFT_297691 [Schizophyllum commune]
MLNLRWASEANDGAGAGSSREERHSLLTASQSEQECNASVDRTSLLSARTLDLTAGVAVREGTPTTKWESVNAISYLPYHTTDNPLVNVLAWDANCVDLCAKMFPNALNRPDMVTVLSSGPINDVLDQAVASLEQGLSVVVKGGGVKVPQVSGRDDIDDAMTPDYWGCRFSGGGGLGLDLHTPLEVHDLYLREIETPPDPGEPAEMVDIARASPSTSHKKKKAGSGSKEAPPHLTSVADDAARDDRTMMSLADFYQYIQDASNPPRCILDLLPGLPGSDPIIERLSDGHLVTRTRYFKDTIGDYDMLPSDVWRTFDWCLLHQRGFFTMPHFDAMGLGTSVQVRGKGRKMWIILRFTPPRIATFANLAERMKHVVAGASKYGASRGDFHIPNSDWNIGPDNGAILVLEEGDLFIQAPGTAHAVFTPTHCATAGKHWCSLHTLQHMEFYRAFEVLTDTQGTNHDHVLLHVMLIYMAAAVPSRVRNGERFRRKSMLALCLMILWPDRYIPKSSQAPALVAESERSDGGRLLARFLKGYGKWARLEIDKVAVSVCERIIQQIAPRRGAKETPSAWYARAREYNVDGAHWQHPGDHVDLSFL